MALNTNLAELFALKRGLVSHWSGPIDGSLGTWASAMIAARERFCISALAQGSQQDTVATTPPAVTTRKGTGKLAAVILRRSPAHK